MIELKHITKIYETNSKTEVTALDDVNLSFSDQGLIFILGQSGSGKTTLLNLVGGMDKPTQGEIIIDKKFKLGTEISFEEYRQNYVGFVFQEYNLLDDMNVFDNINLAVTFLNKEERKQRTQEILDRVELSGYEKRKINELSGGQKQRIAIARALAQKSKYLLCDEPTGNLDSKTGNEVFELLKKISADKTVIVISHNEELAQKYADRIVRISDGKIIEDKITDTNDCSVGEPQIHNETTRNKVSFYYKVKYGIKNLFLHKFKTFISFVLLLLSLMTMCVMQICVSYNSENSLSKSLDNKNSLIVLKNNSKTGDVSAEFERYPLNDNLSDFVSDKDYVIGRRVDYGTCFIVDELNQDILSAKEFYFKENLLKGYAYVTDYFVDIIIGLDSSYSSLSYDNYEQLKYQEVGYQGKSLFKIAGVIQTDYKDYYDARGNEKAMPKEYDSNSSYRKDLMFKKNYNYQVMYMSLDTFEEMYLSKSEINYGRDLGYDIQIKENDYKSKLENIAIIDAIKNTPIFFNNTGYFGTLDNTMTNEQTNLYELQDDEIIINGDFYNYIFGSSIDWEQLYRNYSISIDSGEPLRNALPKLGTEISIKITYADKSIINIENKKVVGVSTNYSLDKEAAYSIYGTRVSVGLSNEILSSNYVAELNWKNIKDKNEVLTSLRNADIVIFGAEAALVYEKEYIIHQMSYFLIGVAIVISLISLISIFNLVNAKIRDKKREIGILVAIGLRKREVNFIYLFSMICMILVSSFLTLGFLYLVVFIVNTILRQNPFGFISYFNVTGLTYLVILVTSIIMFIASLYPLIRITNKKPVDIIKN